MKTKTETCAWLLAWIGRGAMHLVLVAAFLLLADAPVRLVAAEKTVLPANHGPVVVVLDASGSMGAALGAETRLDAARRVLLDTMSLFPADRPVALVAYGHRRKSDCADIETLRGLAPVDIDGIRRSLAPLQAKGKTPLSGALRHAAGLLPNGGGTIMLVSDGLETCREDPCVVAEALKKANAALVIHVVGFGLAKGEMKRLSCIADKAGGQAIETGNAKGLETALKSLAAEPSPATGETVAQPATETATKPVEPPPPTPKPVLLKAVVGANAVPGTVSFAVVDSKGETVYAGSGREVTPSLLPGRYSVEVSAANSRTNVPVTVTGDPDERHDIPLDAGFVHLSVIAAKGLAIADADLKGDPAWMLNPSEGQADASLDAVLAPEAMLAPGRYEASIAIGEYRTTVSFDIVAGKTIEAVADLKLGKVMLEAALPGTDKALDGGTGLSWTLSGGKAGPEWAAEAVARPTFLAAAGQYTARLLIAGATIEKPVSIEAGETKTVRLDLPSSELTLEGGLGAGTAVFADWRDTSWTVRPVKLIGDAKAEAALEDKMEAMPTLTLLPGEWEVTLKSGLAAATRKLTLQPGMKARERVDLGAARLTVSAAPEAGSPPPMNVLLSVFAAGADGGFAEKPMTEVGTPHDYSFVLPAGRYRIDAADEQGRKGTTEIDLQPGQSAEHDMGLK